jgi:hypothetical protein
VRLDKERLELSVQPQMSSKSVSRKVTAPLRFAKRELLSLMQAHFRADCWVLGLLHRLTISILRFSMNGALRFVWLRKTVQPFSNRFPRLKERFLRMGGIGVTPSSRVNQSFDVMSNDEIEMNLPKTARRIYFALKQQCDLENKEQAGRLDENGLI